MEEGINTAEDKISPAPEEVNYNKHFEELYSNGKTPTAKDIIEAKTIDLKEAERTLMDVIKEHNKSEEDGGTKDKHPLIEELKTSGRYEYDAIDRPMQFRPHKHSGEIYINEIGTNIQYARPSEKGSHEFYIVFTVHGSISLAKLEGMIDAIETGDFSEGTTGEKAECPKCKGTNVHYKNGCQDCELQEDLPEAP